MSAKAEQALARELAARQRACFDREQTHLRVGQWRGKLEDAVTSLGSVWELHGTVCTCCPKRQASA